MTLNLRWYHWGLIAVFALLASGARATTNLIHVTVTQACVNNSIGKTGCDERWDYADASYLAADLCGGTCKYAAEGAWTTLDDSRAKVWMCPADIAPGPFIACPQASYVDKTQAAKQGATPPPVEPPPSTWKPQQAHCPSEGTQYRKKTASGSVCAITICELPNGWNYDRFCGDPKALDPNTLTKIVAVFLSQGYPAAYQAAQNRDVTDEELTAIQELGAQYGPTLKVKKSTAADASQPVYAFGTNTQRGAALKIDGITQRVAAGSTCDWMKIPGTNYFRVDGLTSTTGKTLPRGATALCAKS